MKQLLRLPPGAPVAAFSRQFHVEQAARAKAEAAAAEAARLQAQKKAVPWYSCLV